MGVLNLLSFEREVWVEHEEKETKGSALQTQLKKRIWYQLMGSKHIKRDISTWSCSKRFVSYFWKYVPYPNKTFLLDRQEICKKHQGQRAHFLQSCFSFRATETEAWRRLQRLYRNNWTAQPSASSLDQQADTNRGTSALLRYRAKPCQVLQGTAKNSSKDSHRKLQRSHPLLLASNIRKETTEVKGRR